MYDFGHGTQYQRVDKRIARKLYNEGRDIYVVPNKVRIDNSWGLTADVQRDYEGCQDRTFDQIINEFIFYNCGYAETGRYPAYYIKEGEE